MEICTLDRGFHQQDVIDVFESALWAERYYGDGDFNISVVATMDMLSKLPKGQLMWCEGSNQPMILENREIKNGLLKVTGITLTQWLNNRILRTTANRWIKEWNIGVNDPGDVITQAVHYMCVGPGPYLNGTISIGIPDLEVALFQIPGLIAVNDVPAEDIVLLSIPFGPLYDAIKPVGETYEIGMKIVLDSVTDDDYEISFHAYRGADRTSDQDLNSVVQFSPEMDSFTNISDLDSIEKYKNYVYIFAPSIPPENGANPGSSIDPSIGAGFDLRVLMDYADDVTEETAGTDPDDIESVLDQKAAAARMEHKVVQLVDGQVVEVEDAVYGTDFFLGDVVEVKGNMGVLQKARITEYIRSQDKSGERAYPTLSMIDE